MTSPNRIMSLDEVLDEFFFSVDKPSPNIVLRACEAHPEYRTDILEFSALWSSFETTPEPENATALNNISEESVSRLQSFALNLLHEQDHQPVKANDFEAAKKALESLAGGALRRAATAALLGASTLLLQKILTRTVTDVPLRVIASLANHLNVTTAALQQSLISPMEIGRSYRAKNKPSAPVKETWENAVLSLPISDDEKNRLLALQTEEDSH